MNYLNYLIGTGYIMKDKIVNYEFNFDPITRIYPKKPLLEQYMYFYSEPSLIIPNLYLGSAFNAYNISHLEKHNINVIINITKEISNYYSEYFKFTYYKYPILDNDKEDITNILQEAANTIDYHLSRGDRVLVHCYMGASRSASVIIYYLMKYHNKELKKAIKHVKSVRPIINLTNTICNNLQQQYLIN